MGKYSIGVDLGGTKILAGVVNTQTGEVIGHAKKKTKKDKGAHVIIQRVVDAIEKAICVAQIPMKDIESIGIGAAGQVNKEDGVLIASPNLGCYDVEFKKILEGHFNIPVYVGNDVEVATLGEMKFGNAVGYDNFLCVFVGTGIGSGLVVDGKIIQGNTGTAGEIGHIIVDSGGRPCRCGGNGCLEAYASRTAIEEKLKNALKKGRKSVLLSQMKEEGSIRSGDIQKALEQGDDLVLNTITEAAEYLSSGLASVINLMNPQLVVLGGGLVDAVDFFYEMATKKALAKALPTPIQNLKIEKAGLGDFSGIVGAAILKDQ